MLSACGVYGGSETCEDIKTQERRMRDSELRSCVKVEVSVLVFPSLIVLLVLVDVK